jgi:hypothetical protein
MNKTGMDSVNPSVPASVNSSRISSPTRQVLSDGILICTSFASNALYAVFNHFTGDILDNINHPGNLLHAVESENFVIRIFSVFPLENVYF